VIQLQILSGKQAGHDIVVRRFPFRLGREVGAGLPLDEEGVWERHLEIVFQRGEGVLFTSRREALAIINGERVEQGMLRNGDLIELGSVQIRFWLARSGQKTMRIREALTWSALILLFTAQIALIYWLLR
jgi:pSer/pThr/pTyr-binding forkhead associated (FHA) protein